MVGKTAGSLVQQGSGITLSSSHMFFIDTVVVKKKRHMPSKMSLMEHENFILLHLHPFSTF